MHAVVTTVTIEDPETTTNALREQVVPQVRQAPGFVAGYWTLKDDTEVSIVIFESEDAAEAASERVRAIAPDEEAVKNVEVREVAAHA